MGPAEAFYFGELQHPWLLWAAALAALSFALTRESLPPSARRYCLALAALSALDAWLSSSHVYGLGALSGRAASLVPLFFVLAGDFRFLLLLGAARAGGRVELGARALAVGAGLTALVPVASQLGLALWPGDEGARVLFLVYELLFAALALGLLARHPRVAALAWLRQVTRFVLLYYALWASADVLILAGAREAGFALRVVPNVLYYGGLIAAIGAASARAGAGGPAAQPGGTA